MLGTSRKIFAIGSIVVLSEVLDIGSRALQRDSPRKCQIVLFHLLYSQLCCVEGEKERERMMQNENKTQLLTIIITNHMIVKHE